MGILLKAESDECGFNDESPFGGGMFNFKTNCPVPAIEKKDKFIYNNKL